MERDARDDKEDRLHEPASPTSVGAGLQSWQRPALTILGLWDAETGVNSTTDSTSTFS